MLGEASPPPTTSGEPLPAPPLWELLNLRPLSEPRLQAFAVGLVLVTYSAGLLFNSHVAVLALWPYHLAVLAWCALGLLIASSRHPRAWAYAVSLPLLMPSVVVQLARHATDNAECVVKWSCITLLATLCGVVTARQLIAAVGLALPLLYWHLGLAIPAERSELWSSVLTAAFMGSALALVIMMLRSRLVRLNLELKDARDRAVKANEATSALVASVTHEIRNPMNGVLGVMELLQRPEISAQERARYLGVVSDSSRGLMDLLDDLLHASRLEAGELPMRSVTFSPVALLRSVTDLYTPRSEQAGVQLRLVLEGPEPPVVEGAADRLRQVITNLCANAIKFTPRGEVRLVLRAEPPTDGRVRLHFSVCDTGIGIAEDKLDHIFERFAQADESIEQRYGGTGLGLHISNQLVEVMGGRLQVSSRLGVGSDFSFTLEFEVASADQPDATREMLAPDTQRQRVLVADDGPINRAVAEALARSLGHVVSSVDCGQAALDRLEQESFDVLLLDLQMPDLDGATVCRRIRAHSTPAVRDVRVIALTGATREEAQRQSMLGGMDGFLTKPVTGVQLAEALSARRASHSGVFTSGRRPQTGNEQTAPSEETTPKSLHR